MPLSWAARKGRGAAVELLLAEDGVDPDSKDDNGRTPLSRAAEYGQGDVVRLFRVQDGADLGSKDNNGRTPLSRATRNGTRWWWDSCSRWTELTQTLRTTTVGHHSHWPQGTGKGTW